MTAKKCPSDGAKRRFVSNYYGITSLEMMKSAFSVSPPFTITVPLSEVSPQSIVETASGEREARSSCARRRRRFILCESFYFVNQLCHKGQPTTSPKKGQKP